MCGGGKNKESAASKRGKATRLNIGKNLVVSKQRSHHVSIKKKKSFAKQEVVNLNINPMVIGALKSIPIFYQKSVYPLEEMYPINAVSKTLPWTDTEIIGKPTIIIVGASGTGKTSMINFFLDSDYKGSSTSNPTNSITVIQFGVEGAEILNKNSPKASNFQFKQLLSFGEHMEERISIVNSTSNCLKYVNLIDTPGYRSNEFNRNYNEEYDIVYQYLFERVEGIIVTFDQGRLNESMKELVRLLSKHLHKTVFVLNKSEEVAKTDELIKTREKLLWFLSNEIKNDKPPQLLLGSYKKTPVQLNPNTELYLKDMDEINENIKKIYIQNVVRRLECIGNHCNTVFAYATFFTTFVEVVKKHYLIDKCSGINQIESAIKLAFKCMPKNDIVNKIIPDPEPIIDQRFKLLNKSFKPCESNVLKELQEFIEVHFVNILNAGKEECEKLFKTSDFVLPKRTVIEKQTEDHVKKMTNENKRSKETQVSKDTIKDNEEILKLKVEKKALELENKKRQEEIRIKNELEAKEKHETKLKEKLEAEIRLKLEMEMQKKLEAEKAKIIEEEKRLADQEKIRKLEEEKLIRDLKEKQSVSTKKSPNNPVIVVVKDNNDKDNASQRSNKSYKSGSEKSKHSEKDKGFKITLV